MEISVRCGCGRNLSVSSELAGKKIKCAQCGAVSLVPSIPGNDGLNNDGHTDFKPHIALIGTEGSGKTVLTTVLAKYLTDTGDEHLYLDPSNTMTMKYIENMWQTLKGGEWPPSTPPGELFTLEWTFSAGPDLKLPMRLIDSAGQDLRVLFGDDLQPDESRPEQIRQLLDYCRGASILIVLINLKDFVGEAQNERCLENQAVLKQAISHLNKYNPPKRIAFVFTQCDLYESVISQPVAAWVYRESVGIRCGCVLGKNL